MGAKAEVKQNLEVADNQVTVGSCFTDAPKMTIIQGSARRSVYLVMPSGAWIKLEVMKGISC